MNPNVGDFVSKRALIYLAAALAVGLGGGVLAADLFFEPAATGDRISQQASLVHVPIDGRPSKGPEDAPVTLVEFTDYQCPFCESHFRETSPQLLARYEGRLKYVVLNFPVDDIHPQARKAAEAAECAYEQRKFWEYHDLLFQDQQSLGVDNLKQYAVVLGLDKNDFDTCLDSGSTAERVVRDVRVGLTAGVRGTPTFFINGRMLEGSQPLRSFEAIIDSVLPR